MPACTLLVFLVLGSFGALLVAAWFTLSTPEDYQGVLAIGGYSVAFLLFITGAGAWTRARSRSSGVPRVILFGALFLAFVGPWIAMAITGAFAEERASLVAAPSPLYAFELRKVLGTPGPERQLGVLASSVACVSWALVGLGLLALAGGRVERRRAEERALKAQLEASVPPPEAPAPPPPEAPAAEPG
jgi:hypothetical protein